jgi:chemotaxis protein CheD
MGTILIGLGELAVSTTPGDTIRTLGLGSCVAVSVTHLVSGAIGMVHVVLPESSTNAAKASTQPGYFADTGIPALFESMDRLVGPNRGRYIVKLAGGAAVLSTKTELSETMNIGKRNVLAVKKALWKRGLGALAEDVGGEQSRSVSVAHGKQEVEIRFGMQITKVL